MTTSTAPAASVSISPLWAVVIEWADGYGDAATTLGLTRCAAVRAADALIRDELSQDPEQAEALAAMLPAPAGDDDAAAEKWVKAITGNIDSPVHAAVREVAVHV